MLATAPRFHPFSDPDELVAALVPRVASQLRMGLASRPAASLVVPGGRTPVPFFERLSREPLDWSRVWITLSDERCVPVSDPASNERLVRQHLLKENAADARMAGLWTPLHDPVAAAAQAWRQLEQVPRPFDAVVLGMGDDGHFASLFPGDAASQQGLRATADAGCTLVQAPAVPALRISLNLPALLQSRQVALLTTGAHKWSLLQQEADAARTQHLPVRALLAQRRVPLDIYGTR